MPRFLLIETSTAICSVSLSDGIQIIARRQASQAKAHASLLAVFIDQILDQCGMEVKDCAAIAVSGGPGSYTGLRVGVSTAKGLCFGASLPLIHVSSLELIAQLYLDGDPQSAPHRIYPMIDARRMEVYTAPYSVKDEGPLGRTVLQEGPVQAVNVTGESFMEDLARGPIVFAGDGAPKCRNTITHPNAIFADVLSHADGMAHAALKAYTEKNFVDLAYYTPFYLKEFTAIRPKTKL
ncbi:MAG: tRNA threonylcarbamoyladenosine biosynthesis protein TsaB [Bacteroidetes bacterium ADurb.Bin037]|nr:MAG: tRNA threonylcarbamoyladenosine biosynthesis protein TsaB [Bacteroidetes bacterium ADurb.Bin037]HPW77830.1 tRNA (adenosine(37)-N6)-threonylcarbamoyltransferase complex dimerization subunit type 1 TsaB [Bacteroidales bacterium]HQB55657.1 tRNA (adenosine(37)-N6)-threonylcarbamoyltransferase complex dimerization subunit type 1 TsaB [Bacteroidales bacterium]